MNAPASGSTDEASDGTSKSHAPTHDRHRSCDRRLGVSLRRRTRSSTEAVRWRGSALGAQVSIDIFHPDREEAERLVQVCLAEVRRLEGQFSLYRADSAICVLNRSGILVAPEPDMVALLKVSLQTSDLTGGAFDPTVQPLWQLYAEHFSSEKSDPDGPPAERLTDALAKVGRSGLRVSDARVSLVRHGAAITLNGIAQGYATDRVVDILRTRGLSTTLVNMGEIRALGRERTGRHGASASPIPTGPARSPKPLTSSIARSRHRQALDSG